MKRIPNAFIFRFPHDLFVGFAVLLGLVLICDFRALACTAATVPMVSLSPEEVARQKQMAEAMMDIGRKVFSDPRLSASGRMSCANCHSPAHAYGPPDGPGVLFGGASMKRPGMRAAPSLRYLQTTPPFIEHAIGDEDFNLGQDTGPAGGHAWDGRVNTLHEQALTPLFAPHEMANGDPASFVARLRHTTYAKDFQQLFGADIFDDPQKALAQTAMALEVFQENAAEFYPYSSKYDAFLRGKAKLSEPEARGLALFNDPEKGNCFNCHNSQINANGAFPQFTDYGYGALGVPRNRKIAANRQADHFDLGLCGPDRTDLTDRKEYCGQFKVPTLRNVANRHSFFHNGVFHSLQQVMEFYVDRDIHPERWYPRQADGSVLKYDDMPEAYRGNVNHEVPFDRSPGQQPRLSAGEIKDVIAFLKTLTDGYQPEHAGHGQEGARHKPGNKSLAITSFQVNR